MRKLLIILILLLVLTLSGCYSCRSWNHMWGKGPVQPGTEHKFFFDKNCKLMAKEAPKPAPKPMPVPEKPKPAPANECGSSTVTRSYPCSSCAVIRLDKMMPSEVEMNAAFDYTINVTNATDMEVANVVVTERLVSNFTFKSASPAAEKDGDMLAWKLGSFAPNESKVLKVTGMAPSTDCVKTCANATYEIPACALVKVVHPKLMLTKTAPEEVMLCDPIPVKFVVTNPGSGSARDVKITDSLPAGLTTSEGQSNLVFNAGTLEAGQSRQFTAMLKAAKTGKYVNKAVANSPSGLKAEAETTTVVRQPVLAISKTGPENRYLSRSVTYEITVSNKGDAAAKDLVVADQLPSGVTFVSASDGGKAAGDKVQWDLGSLAAGQSRKLSVTVMPVKAGTITNSVMASATCAEGVRASVKTEVAGIPAVLLEVIDVDDPVEIGSQTTYVIIATNQGTSPGTNISIVCGLEDNEQYVSASGATQGTVSGNTVTFAPLKSLAPKDKATWRVVVKAVKAGDVRFKVTMNTDQIDRPVEETEATHLYE